ncbi:class I SAM-dependent methyltransferase [Ethanoligenens harbinense]|nr:methyltransferase domain-containing protein [Ethanoligenens harbinense]
MTQGHVGRRFLKTRRSQYMAHKFDPSHLKKLDSEERRNLLSPAQTLVALGFSPDQTLADIGCGTGLFTLPAAEINRGKGTVYAVDIAREMLDEIGKRAAAAGLSNITTVQADEYGTNLPDAAADFLLVCTVLHEVDDKVRWLQEAARICRKGGSIAVIEFDPSFTGFGPPAAHRLPKDRTMEALRAAGFTPVQEINLHGAFYVIKAARK